MSLLKVRLTAADVVPGFKKVFMGQVQEAKGLPERYLYADTEEATDEESENGEESIVAEVDAAGIGQVNFKDFLTRLVSSAKIYGELVLVKTTDAETNRHLRNLRMIKVCAAA